MPKHDLDQLSLNLRWLYINQTNLYYYALIENKLTARQGQYHLSNAYHIRKEANQTVRKVTNQEEETQ